MNISQKNKFVKRWETLMLDYLLVFLSVVFLAASFMVQKLYQKKTVSDSDSAVNFNLYAALITIFIFLTVNGFKLTLTPYSVLIAAVRSLCGFTYSILSFLILKRGSVSMYMLFLMSGGMIVPAVWGWIFLDERVLPLRVLGIALIVASIVISNYREEKHDKLFLVLCTAVFFLNGFVSVFSKLHQINPKAVSTNDFVIISTFCSLVFSIAMKLWNIKGKGKRSNVPEKKIGFGIVMLLPLLLVVIYSAIGGISSYLQLVGAKNLPSSVLYPMITGGTVVLSGIFALICFGEKPSRREWVGMGLCLVGTCFFL